MKFEVPKATHVGELKIGNITIPCAVLEDGTRVLWQKELLRAIGRAGEAAHGAVLGENNQLPVFLKANNLQPFISQDLTETSKVIKFRPLAGGRGGISNGYKAELLPRVCNVFLEANDAGALRRDQMHIHERCKILIRGFALVGITALVDEATGYQEVRDKLALQAILDSYLRKELGAWARRFPEDFYKEMFRLKGWTWSQLSSKRPPKVGEYTADLVYERLAPGLLQKLRELNPKDDRGNRKARHHQWLTEDIGDPALAQHLHAVIAFMRASSNWEQFYRMMQRAFPKRNTTMLLPLPDFER